MYEFHGWFGLAESTEESDAGNLDRHVDALRELLSDLRWPTGIADLRILNGQPFLTVAGLANRMRQEWQDLDGILEFLAARLPGSWGLLYERAADMPSPPGPNAFRVRVLARGKVTEESDPFLSPCRPTIED